MSLFKDAINVSVHKKTRVIVYNTDKVAEIVEEPVLRHEHQWNFKNQKKPRLYGYISINPVILNQIENCDLVINYDYNKFILVITINLNIKDKKYVEWKEFTDDISTERLEKM